MSITLPSEFIRHLNEAIDKRGLKRTFIAAKAGLSKQAFSGISNGNGNVTLETLERLAHAVGAPVEELLGIERPTIAETRPDLQTARGRLQTQVLALTEAEARDVLELIAHYKAAETPPPLSHPRKRKPG